MSFLDDLNAGMNSIADAIFGRGQRQNAPRQGGWPHQFGQQQSQPQWQGQPQGWQGRQGQPVPQPQWHGQQAPQPQPWQGRQVPQPQWQGQPGQPQGWQGGQPVQRQGGAGQDPLSLGIGALAGAVFGAGMAGKGAAGAAKSAAMIGAGVAAWQFFKKWSAGRQAQKQGWPAAPGQPPAVPAPDPSALLAVRALVYAARADGVVDAGEQERIASAMRQFFPGQDASQLACALLNEPIDVRAVAAGVASMEQAEDVYAMSCMSISIDSPGERAYMNDLAAALGIPPERRDAIEKASLETQSRLPAQEPAPAQAQAPVQAPALAQGAAPMQGQPQAIQHAPVTPPMHVSAPAQAAPPVQPPVMDRPQDAEKR